MVNKGSIGNDDTWLK